MKINALQKGLGEACEGEVLVLNGAFSARYDLDIKTGEFLRPNIVEDGVSVKGKILVADRAKGGVASSWLFHEMVRLGTAPKALIFNNAGPVMIQASAFSGISILDKFDGNICSQLNNGQRVFVSPKDGVIEILNNGGVAIQ
ncbi:DUF126 domain-containing protein [Photobacterium sanctipauli]|uniref:DUF126 domain-containing protein n=1 Tax=Photobacterium sanctipauli TaxID=1342794 RepID=A0A2T3NWI2_9GAMM|nr:DUF126 domain-containing protein [Photobacterium sanctipauli]PSW20582.1 DUF126 domain-containing protein [Photobacterium sanctipauli]